jgi:G3E family GTPase
MKKKVDVVIVGFLRSGKSTLLSRLLSYEKKKGRKVAVLMNELGKVSIDSSVVPTNIP